MSILTARAGIAVRRDRWRGLTKFLEASVVGNDIHVRQVDGIITNAVGLVVESAFQLVADKASMTLATYGHVDECFIIRLAD